MHERLRILREHLGLTRMEFGAKLGVSGDVVNNLERGRVDLKDPMILLLEKTFGVSSEWLRNGTGEMFSPVSTIDELVSEFELSDIDRVLIERFLRLPKEKRVTISDYILDVAKAITNQNDSMQAVSQKDLEAAYAQTLHSASRTASSASSTIADTGTDSDPERKTGEAG